jgi:hypothetical protein
MRRFVVSGLVPVDPVELADHFLDPSAAPQIWPQIREQTPDAAPGGWWECSVSSGDLDDHGDGSDAGAGEATVRLRRASPVEIHERSTDGLTVHRFLAASGGCLWTIESHASPRPSESWHRFARRRERDRARAMTLVDTAAGYFASLL